MDLHFLCMLKRELRDLLGELVKNVKRAEQRVSSSSFWLAMSELCQILLWVGETLLCRNSQPTQSDRLSGHHQALWHIFLAYAVSLLPCILICMMCLYYLAYSHAVFLLACILIFRVSITLHSHILCLCYLAFSYSIFVLSDIVIFSARRPGQRSPWQRFWRSPRPPRSAGSVPRWGHPLGALLVESEAVEKVK